MVRGTKHMGQGPEVACQGLKSGPQDTFQNKEKKEKVATWGQFWDLTIFKFNSFSYWHADNTKVNNFYSPPPKSTIENSIVMVGPHEKNKTKH